VTSQVENVDRIVKKRSKTGGGVVNTIFVASERLITVGRVSDTQSVAKERTITNSDILAAG
jgi:hypothetical protein